MSSLQSGSWDEQGAGEDLTAIELALGEGSPAAQALARQRAAQSPRAMLELAEARAFLEQCRMLTTAAGPTFGPKLADVVAKAERRLVPVTPRGSGWPVAVAAAAVTFVALQLWDPLARPAHVVPAELSAPVAGPVASAAAEAPAVVADSNEVAWSHDIETMRRRLGFEASPHLRLALEQGLERHSDPLGGWLDPRNELMRLHLAHELRRDPGARTRALQQRGGLAAADDRVQALADHLAPQLLDAVAFGVPSVEAVALAVRALVAAGPGGATRQRAVAVAGQWLATAVTTAAEPDVVPALAALVECSTVRGEHAQVIARAGARLLDGVLAVDEDNWARRLPALLRPGVRPGLLAEASRVLARLPAFGLPADRCGIVRQLLLGPLRERQAAGEDTPELVAALLFGSADLLGADERDQLELRLRRWKPAHLAADLGTVRQLAWAIEPGRRGFTRQQAELRQLAVLPDPADLAGRGQFVLLLATNYVAWPMDLVAGLAGS